MILAKLHQRLKKLNFFHLLVATIALLAATSIYKISQSRFAGPVPAAEPVKPVKPTSGLPLGPEKHYARENATIMTLCRNGDLNDIIKSIQRLEDRFNRNYHYDWVFLNNEEFTAEFKDRVSRFVSGEAKFGLIPREHWSYPDFIDTKKAKEGRDKLTEKGIIYADSESYRHMCRFNSGFFYKHPLMEQYKYYWRVEPDVNFLCDVDFDPFAVLREGNKIYGFTITIHEYLDTIETLWDSVKGFMKGHPEAQHPASLVDFISDDHGKTYNLCHFWTNFEIADMDFWRSPLYEEFFKHLDSTGGFFYERWGDAPVHSIAASLFVDKEQIHYFDTIGYNHGFYSMCPIDKTVWTERNCVCDMNDDFTFRGYSCGVNYYKAAGLTKPANWRSFSD